VVVTIYGLWAHWASPYVNSVVRQLFPSKLFYINLIVAFRSAKGHRAP
jgi:hypothetical protein